MMTGDGVPCSGPEVGGAAGDKDEEEDEEDEALA